MEVDGELSVLTFNVCFDQFQRRKRAQEIIALINAHQPDLVGLQEVTEEFFELLRSDPEVSRTYLASNPSFNLIKEKFNYGTVLLVKGHLQPEFHWAELLSDQGRGISSAIVTYRGSQRLFVGTVHLESKDNHSTRVTQLRQIGSLLEHWREQGVHDSLLMGDFNFCSYKNYSTKTAVLQERRGPPSMRAPALQNSCLQEILPEHIDAWPFVHQNSNRGPFNGAFGRHSDDESVQGYTFDIFANKMIQNMGDVVNGRMRYDRVLTRIRSGVPIHAELVGTVPLKREGSNAGSFGFGTQCAASGLAAMNMHPASPPPREKACSNPFSAHHQRPCTPPACSIPPRPLGPGSAALCPGTPPDPLWDALKVDGRFVWPSDHFGLFTRVRIG